MFLRRGRTRPRNSLSCSSCFQTNMGENLKCAPRKLPQVCRFKTEKGLIRKACVSFILSLFVSAAYSGVFDDAMFMLNVRGDPNAGHIRRAMMGYQNSSGKYNSDTNLFIYVDVPARMGEWCDFVYTTSLLIDKNHPEWGKRGLASQLPAVAGDFALSLASLAVSWSFLLFLYRHKVFLKVRILGMPLKRMEKSIALQLDF